MSAAYAIAGFRRMVADDLQGGSIVHNGATYPATVGTFSVQQVLVGAGFTPMVMGDAMVAREDLPEGFAGFKKGQIVSVSPNSGQTRQCRVHTTQDLGPLVQITLHDVNQSA